MNTRRIALYVVLFLTVLAFLDLRYNAFDIGSPYQDMVWSNDPGSVSIERTTPRVVSQGTITEKLDAGETLFVDNQFGSVEVTGRSGDSVPNEAVVDYVITVYADSLEGAEEYLKTLGVDVRRSAGGVEVRLDEPDTRPRHIRGIKLNIIASVPATARVNLTNGYGIVRVTNVDGPSKVYNRYSETGISQVEGDWRVDALYSAVNVSGVRGDLRFTGSYGSANLRDITGNLEVESDYREVWAENVGGDLRVHTRFGDLNLAGIGKDADVDVDASYADVRLEMDDVSDHDFDLRAQWGDIVLGAGLEGLNVREDRNNQESVRGILGSGSHEVRIATVYGNIMVQKEMAQQ